MSPHCVGETGRTTKVRLQEHVRNITNQNSEIYKHRRDTGYLLDFENNKIIAQEQTRKLREFVESYFTEITENSINRSNEFPSCYRRILSRN